MRHKRLTKRSIFAVAGVVLASAALIVPVADVSRETCSKIQPNMSLNEVEAIIGGPPGWYDGIGGASEDRGNDPGLKDDGPTWFGSDSWGRNGKICLPEWQRREGVGVGKAKYYPIDVLQRSLSRFMIERLTRNAFGIDGSSAIIDMILGAIIALFVTLPLGLLAVLLSRRQWDGLGVGLCAIGATLALLLCLHAGGMLEDRRDDWNGENSKLLGAGLFGISLFTLSICLCLRQIKSKT
jgi:hypothetical protein